MTRILIAYRCGWCGLSRESIDPPRCYKCKAPLCSPRLRDCGWRHWKQVHDPGLGLNPDEQELYKSGEWVAG